MFGVVLGGLLAVVTRVQAVGMRHVRMMASLFVIARLVMLGSFAVMTRRVIVMLGRGFVVIAAFMRLRAHIAILHAGNCAADTARLH